MSSTTDSNQSKPKGTSESKSASGSSSTPTSNPDRATEVKINANADTDTHTDARVEGKTSINASTPSTDTDVDLDDSHMSISEEDSQQSVIDNEDEKEKEFGNNSSSKYLSVPGSTDAKVAATNADDDANGNRKDDANGNNGSNNKSDFKMNDKESVNGDNNVKSKSGSSNSIAEVADTKDASNESEPETKSEKKAKVEAETLEIVTKSTVDGDGGEDMDISDADTHKGEKSKIQPVSESPITSIACASATTEKENTSTTINEEETKKKESLKRKVDHYVEHDKDKNIKNGNGSDYVASSISRSNIEDSQHVNDDLERHKKIARLQSPKTTESKPQSLSSGERVVEISASESKYDGRMSLEQSVDANSVACDNTDADVDGNKTESIRRIQSTAKDRTMAEEKKQPDRRYDDKESMAINGTNAMDIDQEAIEEMPECDAAFRSMVILSPIPNAKPLPKLTYKEFAQLEAALQIGDKYATYTEHHTWREDWNGNLQLVDKELIMNREDLIQNPEAKKVTMHFCDWVAKLARHGDDFIAVRLLFSFIFNIKGTPPMAKRILAYNIQRPASSVAERLQFVMDASRRISYDPTVLNQDGWTTAKSDVPDGHTGGSYLIGRRVFWHGYEALVIAFVRDEDIGDLWKCFWIEDQDTFDLEADELQEGMKKWEKKIAKRRVTNSLVSKNRPSIRYEANRNFSISGIEDGIILARSYKSKSARPWPARVMHVTEIKALGAQLTGSRRSSVKNEIHVVFLAPFWNGERAGSTPGVPTATSQYATGPLFELETIDVSNDTIQKYQYARSDKATLSITDLQSEFNFLGLPKAAFPRFLDAHRMAMALKLYANKENRKRRHMAAIDAEATASLTETHPLSIKTFSYPDALLNLPFGYILSKFPDLATHSKGDGAGCEEPVMQLQFMLDSLIPPRCFNVDTNIPSSQRWETPVKKNVQPLSIPDSRGFTPTISPPLNASLRRTSEADSSMLWDSSSFASSYLINQIQPSPDGKLSPLHTLYEQLERLVKNLNKMVIALEEGTTSNLDMRREKLASIIVQCMTVKGHCEDFLFSAELPKEFNRHNIIIEWRKTCERIYKRAIVRLGHVASGNGVMAVLTDSRCNEHITANGSFERAVRLPAALKGAKNAGVGSRPSLPLISKIEDLYLRLAEQRILPMAHKTSYLKRMKTKISNLAKDAKGVPLTDGSDGEGGEDTMGSRGSFTAAVTGVAAALKGVDMIIGGKCVNAFCAVRPPGHHAGRSLRPMNAISNGFCLLNAAAGAALYAATPRSQGGLGLKRVCVIDFDLHHGNGTQDILCSTHDPRFLYVSTHAGGPHINGYEDDNSNDGFRRNLNTNKNEGIFPGRCGDTSPHPGVLNIPLGKKVTAAALGTALVCEVTPKVEEFNPELIIISAGFDAHINDPLGMGGLTAENFGTVTKVICQMAMKSCSGRVLSILEGGYGVPCCRPLAKDTFLPKNVDGSQLKLLDLGDELPETMEDGVDPMLAKKLDKCHHEGFLECVEQHVKSLAMNSNVDGDIKK